MDGQFSVIIRQKEAESQKGVFQMKNTFKLFGIIAMTAVIVLSMAACGDLGDDKVDKYLVITGIPDNDPTDSSVLLKGKLITVAICDNNQRGDFKMIALNQSNFAKDVKIPLLSGNEQKKGEAYTGTGKYFVYLFFDLNDPDKLDDDYVYAYTGSATGRTQYRVEIIEPTTTLDFSTFAKQ